MKKVFQGLATLILAVVVLVCVGIFIAPHFGWHLNIVYGGSMEPAIEVGSLIVVKPVEPQAIEVNDVITYRASTESGIVTTHRVIGVMNNYGSPTFRTKGDANEDPDVNAVPAQNVVGRVRFSVPYVGYVMNSIRNPLAMSLLIGIPAMIIIGMELKNVWQAIAEKRRYKMK